MPASRRAASALSMASRKARWAAIRAVGAWDIWEGGEVVNLAMLEWDGGEWDGGELMATRNPANITTS